ncbi:hypothetical protein R1flu_009209 [Riccia fluitans]|uniref:Uncharacterized protein n=1 Tax=Riccia fluitans TaxID=41844 RepID=A0ABD1Z1G0_9MARC
MAKTAAASNNEALAGQPYPSKLEQMQEVHHHSKFVDPRPADPSPPSFSIGRRIHRDREDDKRGPGAYMSIWEQSQGPAYTFRKREPDIKDEGPGPGEYHSGVGYRATIASSPAFSMGARCGPSAFGDPAPGAYEVGKNRRTSGATAFSAGYKAGVGFSRGPGPGTYKHELKSSSPSFSIGTRTRSNNDFTDSPGPGAYEVYHRKTSGPSYSIAPKVKCQVTQRDLNPGPGAYAEDNTATRTRGLAYTMRERFRQS